MVAAVPPPKGSTGVEARAPASIPEATLASGNHVGVESHVNTRQQINLGSPAS